ncbi:chain-length determining protein [uncultured Granulicatella sp.]|uniref:YveK family protein n=1 Tax=uncultured Granulicatella sp. TaxID=316089 RepID=UPI0028EAFAC0|nr:chain-length determining protein [uncultured Granulicatella sp.]
MDISNNMTKIYSVIKSKLLFLIIFILLGVGGVTLYTMFAITPVYSVSSTLILKIMNSEKNDSQVMEALNLFQRQAKTYLEIAALSPVKEATDKALELSSEDASKIKSIKLTNDSGSQLMTLTIKASDRDLANQYIKQYVKQYKQFTTEKFGRDDLAIVSEAQGSLKPIYPVLWKNMLIAFIVFSFIAFNIIFIRYVMSDSIDSSDELEELTGVPTLGMIPVIEKKERR